MTTSTYWPADEWKRAKDLLDCGFTPAAVGAMIGKSAAKVRGKWRWERMTPEQREARQVQINNTRKSRAQEPSERRYQPEMVRNYGKVPDSVIEDRARRQALERCPIDELLGIPPPGYSALDRKRQAVVL